MTSHPKNEGYLEVILGCMFSGKTSALVEIYKQHLLCDSSCLVINFSGDRRYSRTHLSTHDQKLIPCVFATKLEELWSAESGSDPSSYDVILINEGQFFEDLVPFVKHLVNHHKRKVFVCGLDGDFKKQKFGTILDLIPEADNFRKLRAICIMCKDGTPASFTHRLTDSTDQTLIGSQEYIPVCRRCHAAAQSPSPGSSSES
jgi:thymidine kinase